MQTIRESLQSVTNFPIPAATIEALATKRGLDVQKAVDATVLGSRAYRLAEADIYRWLYLVANMSQGGQSYNFTADDKAHFKAEANRLYRQLGEEDKMLTGTSSRYGYKGSRL